MNMMITIMTIVISVIGDALLSASYFLFKLIFNGVIHRHNDSSFV